jgi:DNA-binding MarR family transcriptional regulator
MDSASDFDGIDWLTEIVRLEIVLWNRVDSRLRRDHELSLAVFQVLRALAGSPDDPLRVGDLAGELGITVGAASKLVDRVDAAGLLQRQADPNDRRASRLVLTDAGARVLVPAAATYREELDDALADVLTVKQRNDLRRLAGRVVDAHWKGASR